MRFELCDCEVDTPSKTWETILSSFWNCCSNDMWGKEPGKQACMIFVRFILLLMIIGSLILLTVANVNYCNGFVQNLKECFGLTSIHFQSSVHLKVEVKKRKLNILHKRWYISKVLPIKKLKCSSAQSGLFIFYIHLQV